MSLQGFCKVREGPPNDLTWLHEVGAGVAVIGRGGSAPGVPTGHRIPAQGNALGTVNASPGVLKERRIFVNEGRLSSCGGGFAPMATCQGRGCVGALREAPRRPMSTTHDDRFRRDG